MPLPGNSRPPLPTEVQREAEQLRAEAARMRDQAVREAEQIIARAGTVAREVEEESRALAEATLSAARAEGHRLVSGAWQHVDELVGQLEHLVTALAPLQASLHQLRELRASAPLGLPHGLPADPQPLGSLG